MTKQIFAATFFVAAIFSAAANAAWEIGAGVEGYHWQEYTTSTIRTPLMPTESGPRFAMHVNWTGVGDLGLLLAYRGKLYFGKVHYDTYNQLTDIPVSTTTQYSGVAHEGQLLYRSNAGRYKLDYVGGVGWDNWRRAIGYSQLEDYSILYLRGGVNLDQPRRGKGWHGGGGLKYPFLTWENAHLTNQGYYSNPILTPGNDISFYANLGYRINSNFDVAGYYDSWRFKQSDIQATADAGGPWQVWQPKSSMDLLGVRLMYSF